MPTWLNDKIKLYLDQYNKQRIRFAAIFVMAMMVVIVVSAMLLKTGISMGDNNVKITADKTSAVYTDELSVNISAEALKQQQETYCVISAKSIYAGLSESYEFDENNVTQVTDTNGNAVDLHRIENTDGTVDYWFALEEDENAEFPLSFKSEYEEDNMSGVVLYSSSASSLEAAQDKISTKYENAENGVSDDDDDDTLHLFWSRSGEDWKYRISLFWKNADDTERYDKKEVTTDTSSVTMIYDLSIQTNGAAYDIGEFEVRLPYSLGKTRNNRSDIVLDKGLTAIPEAPALNNRHEFNFTIDTKGTTSVSDDEIVITNAKYLAAGVNQTLDICYVIAPFNVVDLTKYEITATATAKDNLSLQTETQTSNTITYTLDTGVKITGDIATPQGTPTILYQGTGYDTDNFHYIRFQYYVYWTNNQTAKLNFKFTPLRNGQATEAEIIEATSLQKVGTNEYTYSLNSQGSNVGRSYTIVVAFPKDPNLTTFRYSCQLDFSIEGADAHTGHGTADDLNDFDSTTHTSPSITWVSGSGGSSGDVDWTTAAQIYKINSNSSARLQNHDVPKVLAGQESGVATITHTATINGYKLNPYNFEFHQDYLQAYYVYANKLDGSGTHNTLIYDGEARFGADDYYVKSVTCKVSHSELNEDGTDNPLTAEPVSIYALNSATGNWDLISPPAGTNWTENATTKEISVTLSMPGTDYTQVKAVSADNLTDKYVVSLTESYVLKPYSPVITQLMHKYSDRNVNFFYTQSWTNLKCFDSATGAWINGQSSWPEAMGSANPTISYSYYGNSGLPTLDTDAYGQFLLRSYNQIYIEGEKLEFFDYSYANQKTVNNNSGSTADTTIYLSALNSISSIGPTALGTSWDQFKADSELREGTFYALLPVGYYFNGEDTIVCTGVDSYYNVSRYTCHVKSVRTVNNWRNTSRQMVIITVEMDEGTTNYIDVNRTSYMYGIKSLDMIGTGNYLIQFPFSGLASRIDEYYTGFHIQFDASIRWDDIHFNPTGSVISSFYGSKLDVGDNDDGAGVAAEYNSDAMYNGALLPVLYDANENGSANDKVLYDGTPIDNTNLGTSVSTGLTLSARNMNESIYDQSIDVEENKPYEYRMTLGIGPSGTMRDIVIYDILESVQNTPGYSGEIGWQGIFQSIDVSNLVNAGIDPVIYYSTRNDLKYSNAAHMDISDSSIWTTTQPSDLSTIKAVAVDARKMADGSEFIFSGNKMLAILITMKAPTGSVDGVLAYNSSAYWAYQNTSTGDQEIKPSVPTVGSRTTAKLLRDAVQLKLRKTDTNMQIPLSDVSFELYEADVNGLGDWFKMHPDNPLESFVSDSNGEYVIQELPVGRYLLYETRAATGYQLPENPWRILVNNDGSITFTNPNGSGVFDETDPDAGTITYIIINSKTYSLPSTGGYGTEIIYSIAAFLIFMSAGGIFIKKFSKNKYFFKENRK